VSVPADRAEAAAELTELLALPTVNLRVTAARLVGRGPAASADLYLSSGETITFDKVRDVGNPRTLAFEVAVSTTATPKLNATQALRAVALLRALADCQEAATGDHIAREWGENFLALADRLDVDNLTSVARASVVLVAAGGTRYIRTGWFRAHVRQEDGSASPQEIANRMQRVGWRRPGQRGNVIARQPRGPGQDVQTFYLVPAGWETAHTADPAVGVDRANGANAADRAIGADIDNRARTRTRVPAPISDYTPINGDAGSNGANDWHPATPAEEARIAQLLDTGTEEE
jgi:hypothetical protein